MLPEDDLLKEWQLARVMVAGAAIHKQWKEVLGRIDKERLARSRFLTEVLSVADEIENYEKTARGELAVGMQEESITRQ